MDASKADASKSFAWSTVFDCHIFVGSEERYAQEHPPGI